MVDNVRSAEKSIGTVSYNLTQKQIKGRDFSRSLYVCSDIKKNELITYSNIKSVRPGFGLHPKYFDLVVGKKAKRNLKYGDRLNLEDIINTD